MNDEAIQKIMNYTNMHLFEPGENWPKSAIMERSYERWAVDEILLAIMDHPMRSRFSDRRVYIENGTFSLPVGKSSK